MAGDDPYAMVPTLRDTLDDIRRRVSGWRYLLDMPEATLDFAWRYVGGSTHRECTSAPWINHNHARSSDRFSALPTRFRKC